jgi:hypothetical protein
MRKDQRSLLRNNYLYTGIKDEKPGRKNGWKDDKELEV